jgi:TRAP-type C4-dicarboxylate transport system permease small subunit
MPDRAIIPLTIAVMGGFFCGLIGSVLLLQDGPITTMAIAGTVATVLAATASVLGVRGRGHASVAILRMFYGACVFLSIDLGLVEFLRNGSFIKALILWIGGALAAGMLVAPRVQDPHRA